MTYTLEEINLITLSSFEELTYKNRVNLLRDLSMSEPRFAENEKNLIKSLGEGVYNKVKGNFYSQTYRDKLLQKLEARRIKCVTYFSPLYPEQLKQIPCPPLTLFCRGDVSLLKDRLFAAVGSRRTPPDVLKECEKISFEISKNFTLVTGVADGADSSVLKGALKNGAAISVLAYGFNHVYPSINKNLLNLVEERGLVITEYTPQIKPLPYNFPARNRIIAGLAEGVLAVSAGEKSGAIITARCAFDYGRQVFALPYSLGVPHGVGCNLLIREGATLVRGAEDILTEFGLSTERGQKTEPDLTREELTVLNIIKNGETLTAAIAEKAGVPVFRLIPVLTVLEMKGLISRLGGNRYCHNL